MNEPFDVLLTRLAEVISDWEEANDNNHFVGCGVTLAEWTDSSREYVWDGECFTECKDEGKS